MQLLLEEAFCGKFEGPLKVSTLCMTSSRRGDKKSSLVVATGCLITAMYMETAGIWMDDFKNHFSFSSLF